MRLLVVTNFFPTNQNPAFGTFIEQQVKSLKDIGLEVDVLFVDRAQEGIRAYFGLGKRVRRRINEVKPDLVHVMYGGVMAELVTRAVKDLPTVVSFCGSDLLGERLSGPLRKLISGYGVVASWKAAERATGIVVKSKNLLNALPENIQRAKIRIIPNGINLERFEPLDQEESRKQLGWNQKGFHVLFPTNAGDPCKRPQLARKAVEILHNHGFQTEIHELSGVPHNQVPLWLNAADAVLLTSLFEGSPNIIKEALACNIPIVSVDVGDVAERIEGIDGCYIVSGVPEDIAGKLSLVSKGLRRIEGRKKIWDLSLEHVARRLENFYTELL